MDDIYKTAQAEIEENENSVDFIEADAEVVSADAEVVAAEPENTVPDFMKGE